MGSIRLSQLKKQIDDNIDSIEELFNQAEELKCVLSGIKNLTDNDIKLKLDETLRNIYNSIKSLIKHNDELFEIYKSLIPDATNKEIK